MKYEDEKRIEILRIKAKNFMEMKKLVHITYTDNGWCNGTIFDVQKDYFKIMERYDGELSLFFAEILNIDLYKNGGRQDK